MGSLQRHPTYQTSLIRLLLHRAIAPSFTTWRVVQMHQAHKWPTRADMCNSLEHFVFFYFDLAASHASHGKSMKMYCIHCMQPFLAFFHFELLVQHTSRTCSSPPQPAVLCRCFAVLKDEGTTGLLYFDAQWPPRHGTVTPGSHHFHMRLA